jgi:hypothetical protein
MQEQIFFTRRILLTFMLEQVHKKTGWDYQPV